MPNILHRLTIDSPAERVHELAATKEGIQQWWTDRPVTGDDSPGGRLAVWFPGGETAAAVFEVVERQPRRILWRCTEGPHDWVGTRITFALQARDDGSTTLLFSHDGWAKESEFMSGCSTNWSAYLMSLKSGAENRGFNPFPAGEISRWD